MSVTPLKRLLVTGAAGFIGSRLVEAFVAKGWPVVACGRRRPQRLPGGVQWRDYDLAWPRLPEELFDGVDALVHAAYVKGAYETNVDGSTLLLDEAQRRGVADVAFLSSLAAHDGALSIYGRQKLALERLFARRGALVVRPGLVLGDGSIFRSMCDYLRKHRFVPLIGGGTQPLQTVYVGDLVAAIRSAIERRERGIFTVAESEPVAYREFYRALCRRLNVAPAFVPVPFFAADAGVRAAHALNVRLPIDRENLLGLRAMRADFGPRLQPPGSAIGTYDENIERALC